MLGAVAAAALVAPARSTGALPTTSQASPARSDRAAIERVLERRARAVLAKDRKAFMSTVASYSRAFVKRQRRLFAWTTTVPLASYRLVARWQRYGDVARDADLERYPGADAIALPLTEERYRIRGFDREAAIEDLFYTFVRRGGRWRIAEDTDLEGVGVLSGRHLWDFGPVQETRSKHFLLLNHSCERAAPGPTPDECATVPSGFLALAEQALERVQRYWSAPWEERVVVLVPSTQAQLSRMLQARFDVSNFVAFASSSIDTKDGTDYTGHRVVVNPETLIGRSSDYVRGILAHELLHVATRSSAGPFVPVFVDEGIADYVGRDADPEATSFLDEELDRGSFNGRLPRDFEFTIGTGTDIFRSYQKAHSAARFFVERWGLGDFVRFYRRLGRVEVAPGTARYHVDRALRKTIGLDLNRFERAWASSIRS